ncbi:hypothetical protein N480_21220 [Pseudoalteromonas luteoviolacea S2607]|uniref:hypothetical protein n=1 Tax=Pseudoalteromonas luteoviolacea TaxID=43657 RepID=UPI0007B08439|nr:hypothetical protein [Pseudoalteromonas luteoviolacea]KZN34548.1 hypothetical protein N480_21220 [Pseudoalteromonas luteoviolacea S2607]
MINVTIRRMDWFFTRYVVEDNVGLNYSIKDSIETTLERGKKSIFEGDVLKKTYFEGCEVEVSRRYAPKTFKFKDDSDIDYCRATKTNGTLTRKILYKGKFLAEVSYRYNWLKLHDSWNIKIFSDDKEIADKVMFSFMHDYNFEKI